MGSWRLYDSSLDPNWDDLVQQFRDFNPFQSEAYGLYWRSLGWLDTRFVATDEAGDFVSVALARLRRLPFGVGVMTINGGPLGDPEHWAGLFSRAILKPLELNGLFCRSHPFRDWNDADEATAGQLGFKRVPAKVSGSMSMELDLGTDLFTGLSRNWKRNFKKAANSNLRMSVADEGDIDDIGRLYRSMESMKGIGQLWSRDDLAALFQAMPNNLVVVKCEDEEGRMISARGSLLLGDRGLDMISATDEAGRSKFAAYSLFVYLVEQLKRRGIKLYDMGGINPAGNPGVTRFKSGTGAKEVKYLGEFDWGQPAILRPIVAPAWRLRNWLRKAA